ncbi:MAG: hypothetical protein K6E13_03580, partial [Lachnospiraceae bacterium]|nr:hypothetical protein [Lachnospiraceae bacterium]
MSKTDNNLNDTEKLTGFRSIKSTVALLVLFSMIVIAVAGEIIALTIFRADQEQTMLEVMHEQATAYGKLLDENPDADYDSVFKDIYIGGIESSYFMIVDESATIVYHGRDTSKVGNETHSTAILDITKRLQAGENITSGYVEYTLDDVPKLAAYYVTNDHKVIEAVLDKKDVTADITASFIKTSIAIYLVVLIIVAIITYFIVGIVVKPVAVIEDIVQRVANFNLTRDH